MAGFSLRSLDPIGTLIYVVIILTIVFAIWAEYRDTRCSAFRDGKCGPGLGSAYAAGRPHHDDSGDTLLKKVRTTARYEVNSISWRRCFIAAAVSAFLILYYAKKKLPGGIQMGASVIIIYLIFYLTMTSFQKTVAQPALSQLDQILHLLKKRV
jgi:hypothetical protein